MNNLFFFNVKFDLILLYFILIINKINKNNFFTLFNKKK
jgi:hypothetical protein